MRPAAACRGDPYAGIPGRRLFIAVPLPDDAAAAVGEVVDEVRGQDLPAGARDVRWVRLDGLHLTLRFLGPTPEARIVPTAQAVERVAAAAPGPIDAVLAGTGTFPAQGRPRALWIGLSEGGETLSTLAGELDGALAGAGWEPADRLFRPHLTLARSDGVSVGPLVARRLSVAMAERALDCRLDRLGLFESVTGGGPARYVPIALANLGPTPDGRQPVYHQTTPDQH